jgi:hypothetical protein
MTKTYKNFILFFLIIVSILLFFLKKYNDILHQKQIDILVSNTIELIHKEISYQKKNSLSLAILFSKNQNIIDALEENKPDKLKDELTNLLSSISLYAKQQNIQIQVNTKDLKVFVRSWEDKDAGLNLATFRKGLVKVKATKEPFVSYELGKRFNIKAISPIFKNNNYIGSLEVIMDYSSLKERLKIAKIDMIPLLNSKFLNIAKYHQNNKKIYDYVITEKNYDKHLYSILLNNKDILLHKKLYYEIDDTIITFIPLGDLEGEDIGYLVASFKNANQDFNYLPDYSYKGTINTKMNSVDSIVHKKNIIIK